MEQNFHDRIVKCEHCGKELGKVEFKTFCTHYRGLNINHKRKLYCDENCYNQYWNNYIVEEYKGQKIYKQVCDNEERYVPYIDCLYYFKTVEDCRNRIDMGSNIGLYLEND